MLHNYKGGARGAMVNLNFLSDNYVVYKSSNFMISKWEDFVSTYWSLKYVYIHIVHTH